MLNRTIAIAGLVVVTAVCSACSTTGQTGTYPSASPSSADYLPVPGAPPQNAADPPSTWGNPVPPIRGK